MEPPVIALVVVAFIVLFVVIALAGRAQAKRRLQAVTAFATGSGLQFAPTDPFGMLRIPFRLFQAGDGQRIENVCWGYAGGVEVRLFDYWYVERTQGASDRTRRSYFRFTCVLTPLAGVWSPHLTLAPESLGTKLASAVGFRDIQVGNEAFDRAYRVQGEDERLAATLLDPGLTQWLLQGAGDLRLEILGDLLLMSVSRIEPARWSELIGLAAGTAARIPAAVRASYPGGDRWSWSSTPPSGPAGAAAQ